MAKWAKTVNISQHNTYEDWICIMDDGSLLYHYENDGWVASRKGLEATDTPITLEEVAKRYPAVLDKVKAALQEVKDRCPTTNATTPEAGVGTPSGAPL
jgi:hypothetical protein